MPRDTVTLVKKTYYTIDVEAENAAGAESAAEEALERSADPLGEFNGADGGTTTINIVGPDEQEPES